MVIWYAVFKGVFICIDPSCAHRFLDLWLVAVLCLVLAAPQSLQDLSSLLGTEPGLLAMKALSPNHWTTREFPKKKKFLIIWIFGQYHNPERIYLASRAELIIPFSIFISTLIMHSFTFDLFPRHYDVLFDLLETNISVSH